MSLHVDTSLDTPALMDWREVVDTIDDMPLPKFERNWPALVLCSVMDSGNMGIANMLRAVQQKYREKPIPRFKGTTQDHSARMAKGRSRTGGERRQPDCQP